MPQPAKRVDYAQLARASRSGLVQRATHSSSTLLPWWLAAAAKWRLAAVPNKCVTSGSATVHLLSGCYSLADEQ
jgi:hypothetical protein